jgi:hypothetical protein
MAPGDAPVLHAARAEARNGFRQNAALSAGSPELAEAVKHAEEVAQILRHNVVQGKKEGEDLYSEYLKNFILATPSWHDIMWHRADCSQ